METTAAIPELEDKVERFNIQRKIVANMTTESWTSIPHVSYIYKPDVTGFLEAYRIFDEATPTYKISLNTVMLKVLTEGIKAAPKLNAHMRFQKRLVRGKMTYFDEIDVSVPWKLPDGNMMTITVKDAGRKSLRELVAYTNEINRKLENTNLNEALYSVSIHDTLERLKHGHFLRAAFRLYGSKTNPLHRVTPLKGAEKKAYDAIPECDKVTYKDLKQGTITISNIGASTRGSRGFLDMLMIIPPQVCAIGISATQREPIVVTDENGNEKTEIRTVLPMAICFDHRAMDFGDVAPFIKRLDEIFEDPDIVLQDL
ncbi:MAG: 2-oxo acid dehydrogenase subunit E2 [Clostridia bacterium]|nr:2-oxo acid dehydrogenase subunit E2 [Clostridia bacterium]